MSTNIQLNMSKTFLYSNTFDMPRLVRSITIILPCTVCKENTQSDPYSKHIFGVCCGTCHSALENRYEEWLREHNMENTFELKNIYLTNIKNGLSKV